jgi:hypothetical protein
MARNPMKLQLDILTEDLNWVRDAFTCPFGCLFVCLFVLGGDSEIPTAMTEGGFNSGFCRSLSLGGKGMTEEIFL